MIKINDLLPLLKTGYVAMNASGEWCWHQSKPEVAVKLWRNKGGIVQLNLTRATRSPYDNFAFDIAPFEGDWKDSLMECGK